MKLQEFITESLLQIVNGVLDAQKEKLPFNAEISPHIPVGNVRGDKTKMKPLYSHQFATSIKFDVAVTVEQSTGTKGGIGVVAGALALGSQGKTDKLNNSISRLQFEIPVILPHYKEKQAPKKTL